MQGLNEFSKTLGGLPPEALIAVMVLAGFALAAYAIYAVLNIARRKH